MKKHIIALIALLPLTSHAALTYIDTSSLSGAERNEWESFTSAYDVANTGDITSSSGATLTQTTPGAFLTSGGNIYSFNTPLTLTLADTPSYTSGSSIGNVVLQIGTLGTALDYSETSLSYTNSLGVTSIASLYGFQHDLAGDTSGMGGGNDLIAYQWNLTGLDAVSYTIAFASAESSMSLDKVAIDTVSASSPFVGVVTAVPEPGSALLLVASAALLGFRRRPVC